MIAKIAYWLTTGLVVLAYAAGGYFEIAQPPDVLEAATHLGYPLYFFTILGIWKLVGAAVVLLPGLPRLKEWAYAGITINLSAASASHFYSKDGPGEIITPLVVLAIALTSWALRPPSRKLPGSWL